MTAGCAMSTMMEAAYFFIRMQKEKKMLPCANEGKVGDYAFSLEQISLALV